MIGQLAAQSEKVVGGLSISFMPVYLDQPLGLDLKYFYKDDSILFKTLETAS